MTESEASAGLKVEVPGIQIGYEVLGTAPEEWKHAEARLKSAWEVAGRNWQGMTFRMVLTVVPNG